MNNKLAQLIKDMEAEGLHEEASSLKDVMSKEAQFDVDDPYIPTDIKIQHLKDKKLRGIPLRRNEETWLRSHTTVMPGEIKRTKGGDISKASNIGKLMAAIEEMPDGKEKDELINVLNEMVGGMSYATELEVDKARTPDELRERLQHDYKGYTTPGIIDIGDQTVVGVTPGHPEDDIEVYDPEMGMELEIVPKGTKDYDVVQSTELGEKIDKEIEDLWYQHRDAYEGVLSTTIDTFNKNMEDFDKRVYPMLASNFITQSPGILIGNAPSAFDASVETRHKNLASTIKKRLSDLANMIQSTRFKAEEAAEFSEDNARIFTKFMKDVNDGIPEKWIQKVQLIYGNDMDLVIANPLGLRYENGPPGFNNMLKLHEDVIKKRKSGKRKKDDGKSWEDLLNRAGFDPITINAPQSAAERKVLENIHHYTKLTGGDTLDPTHSAMHSQFDAMLIQLNNEFKHLSRLLTNLQGIVNEVSKYKEGDKSNITQIDNAVIDFFRQLENHYKSHNIVTKSGKLSGTYGIGAESKLEIYLKGLYLAKAYDAWRKKVEGEALEEVYPIDVMDELLEPKSPGKDMEGAEVDMKDKLLNKINIDIDDLREAKIKMKKMIAIAHNNDLHGNHLISDKYDREILNPKF